MGAAAALALLVACGTPPAVHVHTLMPGEPPVRAAAGGAAAPIAVVLEPVRLPAQVDQPQWLVRLPDDTLAVLEQERWASPLRDELHDAVLEQLVAAHGALEARSVPPGAAAPWRIGIDLRRFDSVPGREARSEGSWLIRGVDAQAALRCEFLLREEAGGSMASLAAAHRRAVVRLANDIGRSLTQLARGTRATCPAASDKR